MRIGIIASFFETRTDIALLVEELNVSHTTILFCLPKDKPLLEKQFAGRSAIRVIDERRTTPGNFLRERMFLLLKRIPKSRINYYLMELFKASNLPDAGLRKKALRIVRLQKWLPKTMTYDALLKTLSFSGNTKTDDIDHFIGCTECTDDYFFARLIREKKNISLYVYSWDHPCKQTRFPKNIQYAVWNAPLKEDLVTLQAVPEKNIHITGISQFCFIYNYKKQTSEKQVAKQPYIYFGCAIGIAGLIEEEIKIIENIAEHLREIQPGWKLRVRPYPNLRNWQYYAPLKKYPNIELDDQFRNSENIVIADTINEKYAAIESAMAFIHTGSTIGIEACFFNTPVFVIDTAKPEQNDLCIYNFVHQYQNDKYFNDLYPENMIRDTDQLQAMLKNPGDEKYKRPNQLVPQLFPLVSMEDFGKNLLQACV